MARLSNPKNVSFSPSCESGTIYSGIRLRRFSVPDPDPTPIILNVFGNFYIYTVLSIQNKDSTNLCHFVSVRQNFCKQWKQKRREQKSIIYLFLFARSGSETNNSRSGSRKKFPTQFFFRNGYFSFPNYTAPSNLSEKWSCHLLYSQKIFFFLHLPMTF